MAEIDFYKKYPAARGRRVICPYCKDFAVLTDSAVVYRGKSYGPIWYCSRCNAYVGVHKTSDRKGLSCKPMGTLANYATREARKRAHAAFDPIWQHKKCSRHFAYRQLAEFMGIPIAECHIANFCEIECARVVEFAEKTKQTGYWRKAQEEYEADLLDAEAHHDPYGSYDGFD